MRLLNENSSLIKPHLEKTKNNFRTLRLPYPPVGEPKPYIIIKKAFALFSDSGKSKSENDFTS